MGQYGTCVAELVAGFRSRFNPVLVKYIFQKVKDTFKNVNDSLHFYPFAELHEYD